MIDSHIHVFSHKHIAADLHFGRHHLPAVAWAALRALAPLVEEASETVVARAVDAALDRVDDAPDLSGIADLIRLFYTHPADQIDVLQDAWRRHGIAGGLVLIPAVGDYRRATRDIVAAAKKHNNITVFAPFDCTDISGVAGVKIYPALEGPERVRRAVETACDRGLPIVAHCSSGGIRAAGVTQAQAGSRNAPWWVAEALHVGLRPRLVLAHAGGRDAWVRARITGAETAIDRILRDTMPGCLSEYPGAWVGVDTAYHEGMAASDYRTAQARMPAWYSGRVLVGSDWPLHLAEYSYGEWAAAARTAWGAYADDIERAECALIGGQK